MRQRLQVLSQQELKGHVAAEQRDRPDLGPAQGRRPEDAERDERMGAPRLDQREQSSRKATEKNEAIVREEAQPAGRPPPCRPAAAWPR